MAAAALAALVAGIATAVQAAVNGELGQRVGVFEAVAFSALISTTLLHLVVLARRGDIGLPYASLHEPPWLWLGGVMGLLAVSGIAFSPPRIGVFATVAFIIAGQLAASVVVDAFGWLGVERVGVSAPRAVGVVLVVAGAVLTLRR